MILFDFISSSSAQIRVHLRLNRRCAASLKPKVPLLMKFVFLLIVIYLQILIACSRTTQLPASAQNSTIQSQISEVEAVASQTPASLIHSVDFANFKYPEVNSRKTFTLKEGKQQTADDSYSLVEVVYGDATGDGIEEAFIVQSRSTGGSASPFYVYIYTIKDEKAKLLWAFYAGERGDGGLRSISAYEGTLVVELYGKNRVINSEPKNLDDQIGVCCPKFFTRSRYVWIDNRFLQMYKEEVLPNPQGNAAYLPLLERKQT